MASFPDYYSVLGVAPSATPDQIKTAYKRKSLLCHPDRVPAGPGSEIKRKAATTEFQAVADAYYTLSDTGRRASYDRLRTSKPSSSYASNPTADASSFFNFFSSRAGAPDGYETEDQEEDESEYGQPDAEYVFGNVFEDMLKPEVNRHLPFWAWTGAAAGAALGFIAGNLPGAAIGGFAGSKLGAVRDAKGKAVYEVFKDLGADQKAQVLKGLAAKVFGMSGIGGSY